MDNASIQHSEKKQIKKENATGAFHLSDCSSVNDSVYNDIDEIDDKNTVNEIFLSGVNLEDNNYQNGTLYSQDEI